MQMSHEEPGSKDPRPKTKDPVSAIILAAGRSRRMCAFKALLPFGDKTVVESCVKNLQDAGITDIVVVLGSRGDEIRKQLQNCGVSFATNPDPDSEMSASIAVGVEKLSPPAEAVLIALVDHPAIAPSIIIQLVDEWRRRGIQLIQPEYNRRGGHPVLVDLCYRTELMNLDPRRGLQALFDSHRAEVGRIRVDSPFVARDMNTWEEYRQLHKDVFGHFPSSNVPL